MLRMVMDPPWAIRVADQAPLAVMMVTKGEAWVTPEDGAPTVLHPGEIGLIRGPRPYLFGSTPNPTPTIIIHPGQQCEDINGNPLMEPFSLGLRTWGNAIDGSSSVIVGIYESLSQSGRQAIDHLPPVTRIDGGLLEQPWTELITQELRRDAPGQTMVLDRLLDLLTIASLRAWFNQTEDHHPSWWRAAADPTVGHALKLLHNNLAHPWTVATLASEMNVSRATFARRFSELTGQGPIAFLTDARISAASDLLREPGATVGAVAAAVGYRNPFAFSTAFKRQYGISPSQYRRQLADRDEHHFSLRPDTPQTTPTPNPSNDLALTVESSGQ